MQTINVNTNSQVYVNKQGMDMTDLNNKLMANDNFVNIPSYGYTFNLHVLKIQIGKKFKFLKGEGEKCLFLFP